MAELTPLIQEWGTTLDVIGRHRRTGEQKLPRFINGIHRPPHLARMPGRP